MMQGRCVFCGQPAEGQSFAAWVKSSFMDFDEVGPGEGICSSCLFWFDEHSVELARRVGKSSPQRMRNYSHFIVAGDWLPMSKGGKARMRDLLLAVPFPEVAVIADSGQKHIGFRAVRNPVGCLAGWVQFEEHRLWVEPDILRDLLSDIETLYVTFSKTEIEGAKYSPKRILEFGVPRWEGLVSKVEPQRGALLFRLALFLAQRREGENERDTDENSGVTGAGLEGDSGGLQEQVSPEHLGAIREPGPGSGVYEQPGPVHQPGLFEIGGDARD